MSTAVMTLANNLASKLGMGDVGQELVTTLKATAFKGNASDAQFTALMIVANQYSLNPWTREIYAFPDKNNGIVPVVGVDGWARIVNENPQFDGMDFEFSDDSCTCIIYRKDRNHPIRVTEYMNECKRGTQPWQSHPKRMLRHKAMIQAARLAFGYGGIFDQDEAERILEKDVTPNDNKPALTDEQSEKRKNLIINLERTAKHLGLNAYGEEWTTLSKQDRTLVGAEEHARLKALAQEYDNRVVEAEVVEQTPVAIDDFVKEMEGAE